MDYDETFVNNYRKETANAHLKVCSIVRHCISNNLFSDTDR